MIRRLAFATLFAGWALCASADQTLSFSLQLKDSIFTPATLQVPAGKDFELVVHNAGSTAAEFESKPLRQEKVVGAGQTATMKIRALKPGSYKFVDEYHEDVAKGLIIVK